MNRAYWAIAAIVLALCVQGASAEYLVGFQWDRSVDYDAGTTHNATTGNPNTDQEGNAVWRNEYVPLGTVTDWYKASGTLLKWDSSWFGGGGAWVYNNDVGPRVRSTAIDGWWYNAWRPQMPLVRWVNPLSSPAAVRIEGPLSVYVDSTASSFDWIIAHKSGSSWTTIADGNYAFPDSSKQTYSLSSIDWTGSVIPGDEIVISMRTDEAKGTVSGYTLYGALIDSGLTFTLVPEPATWLLVATGLLAVCAIRRRRR